MVGVDVLIPAVFSLLTIAVAAWLNREKTDAETEDSRANALEKYWTRIRQLETDNEQLRTQMADMTARHKVEGQEWQYEKQKLWAEIGQLRSKMARLEQNGGLT